MTRFESLFVLIILVVISMYTVVHVHNRFSAETGSVNSFQSNQMQDLNNTLFALNVELKKMLRDAERLENEANSALAQLRGQTGGPPETEKAIAPAESSQSFRPEPREIISRGKKAVIFTMDSISQCNWLFEFLFSRWYVWVLFLFYNLFLEQMKKTVSMAEQLVFKPATKRFSSSMESIIYAGADM